MRSYASLVALALVTGCSGPADPSCGEGLDPVVVTGLNGVLDDVTPAVEVQLRVPETCRVLDSTWMFWEEPSTVRLGEPPSDGRLSRRDVTVGDDVIFFRSENVGVRLEYTGEEVGPELALVWFTAGEDLAVVDCAASGESLACAVRAP